MPAVEQHDALSDH